MSMSKENLQCTGGFLGSYALGCLIFIWVFTARYNDAGTPAIVGGAALPLLAVLAVWGMGVIGTVLFTLLANVEELREELKHGVDEKRVAPLE